MEKQKVVDITLQIDALEYIDKKEVYQKVFSLGNLESSDINDRLILISLLGLTYQKIKEKDSMITPLAILMKITGQSKDGSYFYQFLETLSIITEDFSYGVKKFDSCGLKTSQEIINKIKELLNTWMPF